MSDGNSLGWPPAHQQGTLRLATAPIHSPLRNIPRSEVNCYRARPTLLAFEAGEEVVPIGHDLEIRAEYLDQSSDRHIP